MGATGVLVGGLLVAVAALAALARLLSIPYPIVLVVGGAVIGFVPGLYTVAVSAAYCLLAALFYPSARAMSECDGKEVEPGRAEPPATSAVPHRYDHRAGLPHDADGGSSDISAHDYHQ